MNIHRIGLWNGRGGHRQVFRYTDEHKHRMGHCNWLPKEDDLCIRVADAGDCFHEYVAIRRRRGGKYVRVGSFGAYIFGKSICTLDERTFHLACAGEPVKMPDSVGDKK